MKDFLNKILKKLNVEYYGFCNFSDIKNDLLECAAKKRLPENSNTIITFLFPYKVEENPPENISRYAAVKDYHLVCSDILKNITCELKNNFKENCFEYFIDNSPINEVKAAVLSGIGVRGKNNLLINEKYGSFCFIGEIVTDYKIQFINNNFTECINCNKCINACVTGFLKNKKNKCLSSITQQKAELAIEEKEFIKNNNTVWGCDICQNICPMNNNSKKTSIKEFLNSYRNKYEENEDITERAYAWRGEKVILRNNEILK